MQNTYNLQAQRHSINFYPSYDFNQSVEEAQQQLQMQQSLTQQALQMHFQQFHPQNQAAADITLHSHNFGQLMPQNTNIITYSTDPNTDIPLIGSLVGATAHDSNNVMYDMSQRQQNWQTSESSNNIFGQLMDLNSDGEHNQFDTISDLTHSAFPNSSNATFVAMTSSNNPWTQQSDLLANFTSENDDVQFDSFI
jgi:type II secretory pathway pseudopilin PulG